MPEDSKKNQDKRKNDPKEQRKPRSSRSQAGKLEKKTERVEECKSTPKVTVPQKPPVYEDPGPEFYKNLKRETEEILKITEEENSKYKKKEIQSNWSKYEMPIESYEEIEEHNAGADYEKLIQAPLSIGGHFQFKHEKSWDINTGPSLYDKYFEINMDNLSLAVSTIPFYERNSVEKTLFSETDMLSMNNRATKYKQKYYDDKSYTTPETEAQDKILSSLKESLSTNSIGSEKIKADIIEPEKEEIEPENIKLDRSIEKDDINLDFKSLTKTDIPSPVKSKKQFEEKVIESNSLEVEASSVDNTDDYLTLVDDPINTHSIGENIKNNELNDSLIKEIVEDSEAIQPSDDEKTNELSKVATPSKSTEIKPEMKPNDIPMETKNPVIESPEDLEKWLDDFLDG